MRKNEEVSFVSCVLGKRIIKSPINVYILTDPPIGLPLTMHERIQEDNTTNLCDDVSDHVHQCMQCQRRLSFDPVEKALLKSHSVKNEIIEFLAFMVMGCVVIASLWVIARVRKGSR